MNAIPTQPGDELNRYATDIAHSWLKSLNAIDTSDDLQIEQAVRDVMTTHLQQLAETRVWGTDNRTASGHMWRIVGDRLSAGSLQLHAREKPLGYAGDFRLLERIGQRDVRGRGLDKAFDHFFQNQSAPNAVRNRAHLLADAILQFAEGRDDPLQIVSYGSGPAIELRQIGQQLSEHASKSLDCVSLALLDIDPGALDFSSTELQHHFSAENIAARRVNLSRLPQLKDRDDAFPLADFIFASGFFDYLNHADAVRTIRFFWERLRPNGQMFIFNFCQDNPSRAYMEWVGNWYLTYRTDDDMRSLAEDSGLPRHSWRTDIEPAGVNRFLTATKPS